MSNTLTKPMMTPAEAKECVSQIHDGTTYIAEMLTDLHDREGWKALGYATFRECCEQELPEFGVRSRIYQLIAHTETLGNLAADEAKSSRKSLKINKTVSTIGRHVSEWQTRELAGLTPEQQREAYAKAVEATDGKPTAAAVRVEAAKVKPLLGVRAATDEKLKSALVRIGKLCGKSIKEALEDGTREALPSDVKMWADQPDATVIEIEGLFIAGFTIKRAIAFLAEMPTESSRIETIIQLAQASAQKTWSGSFGGWRVTVVKEGRNA